MQMAYLFKRLFATINELIGDDDKNVANIRNFLTNDGLGAKIIKIISDLDLSSVTNERKLASVLTKIFPTVCWDESEASKSRLIALSRTDVRNIYKQLATIHTAREQATDNVADVSMNQRQMQNEADYDQLIDNYESLNVSTAELSINILTIFHKLLESESRTALNQIDKDSVPMCCLNFCLDTLPQLCEKNIFELNDQSVIKFKILQLTKRCFNQIMKQNGMSTHIDFNKLVNILELENDIVSKCGLVICILTIYTNFLLINSPQGSMKLDHKCVLKAMEKISIDEELLHIIHKHLIRIICIVRGKEICKKKNHQNHHFSHYKACIFEKILLESFIFIKKYKNLSNILNYLSFKGICCCNANTTTIKYFLRSTTISSRYLNFLEQRIVKIIFENFKKCIHCRLKFGSNEFKCEFFNLFESEIDRRQGHELVIFLHHLENIQRFMDADFLAEFILNVIVPTFEKEKSKFLLDPDNKLESKMKAVRCLKMISNCSKYDFMRNFFTLDRMVHLKDCSFILTMSADTCLLLKYALEKLNKPEDHEAFEQIKSILFSNIFYLMHELMDIYDQVGLTSDNILRNGKKPTDCASDFEILDERTVCVKENLSNLDILYLNMLHWSILCDIIMKNPSIQCDFVANICNNFNADIFFTIAQNAISTMLLQHKVNYSPVLNISSSDTPQRENNNLKMNLNERCSYLAPIIVANYDMNYDSIINKSYIFVEASQKLSDKLKEEASNRMFCMTYSASRDKKFIFKTVTVHRDNFLTENLEDCVLKQEHPVGEDEKAANFYSYTQLLKYVRTGIFEGITIRDAFTKIINRFVQNDEQSKAAQRVNLIIEITSKHGLNYLSSIARNCFDICFRLTDTASNSTKMSLAQEELKLVLLQIECNESSESVIDALQLLLGVAEMKTNNNRQNMLVNCENHVACVSTESIISELNLSMNKITFDESEEESGEDRRTETYFTPDENYDADEEYWSTRADGSECSPIFKSAFSVASKLRNTNEYICKLVIQVLMEISTRFIENEETWDPKSLSVLAQRLKGLKDYLGGSQFLLNGFSPILSNNNPNLQHLQKAILELIDNISTPGALKSLFSLLTKERAPVEYIISRIKFLCNQEHVPKAFSGVKYPIVSSDPNVTSTCDSYTHREIKSFRDIHLSHKLLTPFTEASQIIPLSQFELNIWESREYTISLWLELQEHNNEANSSVHLVSIGTDKMILAVFLNADCTFDFIIMKPNQNFSNTKHKSKNAKILTEGDSSRTSDQSDKENVNRTNIFGIATALLNRDVPNIRTRGTAKNGLKKSLSKEEENSRRLETSRVNVKSKKLKLKCNHWTHVCFVVRNNESLISITMTFNGAENENIEIPIDGMNEANMSGKLQLLFVGAQKTETNEEEKSVNYIMSNVTLFKTALEPYLNAFLYALGPDCESFIECEIMHSLALRGFLDFSKFKSKTGLKKGSVDLMYRLKLNCILIHSVGKGSHAVGYIKSEYGKPIDVVTIGKIPKSTNIASLTSAIYYSGGLSTLLFLFARTVEITTDPLTQSSALYIFLKMVYSNNLLYAEFEQKKLFNLVAHVFKHGNCYRGPGMLKAILDVIYGGSMFYKKSRVDEYEINQKTTLNIQHPSLLMKLLTHFNIFQTFDKTETTNLDLLFNSMMVVVKETHPFKHINRQCLVDHGFYEKLIEFCKIHLANTGNAMNITPSTALVVVELLKMLSKHPPTMWSMNEILKLLMLLHHPSDSFITHDRSKFTYILSNNKPTKVNKSSSSFNLKNFNFSTKIRSTMLSSQLGSSSASQRSSIGNNGTPPMSPRNLNSDTTSFFNETDFTKSMKNSTPDATSLKIKSQKLDELTESQTKAAMHAWRSQKLSKTPTKSFSKRLTGSAKKKSPFKYSSTPIKNRKQSQTSEELDPKLIETFEALMSGNLYISEADSTQYETGISVLQEHLFIMLKNATMLLDDIRIQVELTSDLKIQSLIMFANHHDGNVRAAIIDLINMICTRQFTDSLKKYEESNFWIHLGNQISINPVNMKMVQSCVDWICADKMDVMGMLRTQRIEIKFKPAFRILIAFLPSAVHDVEIIKVITKFLRLVLETHADGFQFLTDYGIVATCVKALMKMKDEIVKEKLQTLLEQIAMKAIMSSGGMHVLWELLYGLLYAERQSKAEAIRDIHINLLHQLLSTCLVEENRRNSRPSELQPTLTVTKTLGTLPSSEIKTRFHMIHDRAIQFVISWEFVENFTDCELGFVKYLIDIYFFGITQGSTIILWGLSPSNNEEIKHFVAHRLITSLMFDTNFSFPEPKMLKSLLFNLVNLNSTSFSQDQLKIITKYCGSSVNQQQQNYNASISAIERIDIVKQNIIKDQLQQVDKVVYKMEQLVQTCIDSAMRMTREVMDEQNRERRQLMNKLKQTQEIDFYREWYELIQRMIHNGAPWFSAENYPTSFELDETEGPGRMRIRMKRTALKINEKFFIDEFKHKASYQHKKALLEFLLFPKSTEKYSIREQIVFTFNAKHLTMEQEIEGEVIITDNQLIFLANHNAYNNSIICDIPDIDEIFTRRYQHKEVAFEVFLNSSKNFFIIFETKYERDIVDQFIGEKIEPKDKLSQDVLTQKWIEGKLTNYEYLIELNKISGRSYNDLMQYPVFPWILTDYENEILDLTVPDTFRKLHKTISTQYEENEEHYIKNYNYLVQQSSDQHSLLQPYHYSSHYSNSGTVLHFLVRLPPFTNMFLLYQDHNFDIPDRTFHSLATTFRLTSKESATDVKELVPEFFYLPEFLVNNEGFNYGKRQSGDQVNDVKLPVWCEESARLFTLIHRQALENEQHVRKNLHSWIDLIFGYKQKGKAAVDAINVFHPATYPEFQISNITDMVERSAYETMVRTYGQMPKQIFTLPHKKSNVTERIVDTRPVLKNVKGLRWGIYTGSPQIAKPKKLVAKNPIVCKQKNCQLVLVRDRNTFFIIPKSSNLMQSSSNGYDLVLWKENDGIVRTKSLSVKKSKKLFKIPGCDAVTCCGSDLNYTNLWFGHQSGNISVYVRVDEKLYLKKVEKAEKPTSVALESIIDINVSSPRSDPLKAYEDATKSKWNFPIVLMRHEAEVMQIKMSSEFKIVVSIGGDGKAVIWDSQKIEYVRTIEPSCNTLKACLTHIDISPTLGDILTVFKPKHDEGVTNDEDCVEMSEDPLSDDFINVSMAITGKSQLRLHTINAKYINHIFTDGVITSTCFSFIKEGTGVNVIAAAFQNGNVRLYSTWNLDLVREIATDCELIQQIAFSSNHFLTILTDREIHMWGSDGLGNAEKPNFHDIVFVN